MLVSVVIPCYNSAATIETLTELVRGEFKKLNGYECEFILVNDASTDNTFDIVRKICAKHSDSHGLNLMRNFGQHNALMCGMSFASGDLILGMDDDMQTHPSQIPAILKKMQEGFDVVYGIYRESTNGAFKRFTSWFNKVSSRIMLGRPKDIQSSNFWCISQAVRDEVIHCGTFSPYVDGLFFRTTHNIGNVEIEHHARIAGSSGYSLRKIAKLWLAYFNYSVVPLRIASILGLGASLVGFLAGVITVVRKLIDPTIPMGWTSIVCLTLFLAGLILFVLGIIGEYVGDAVLMLNRTPQYIIREKINLE